MLALVLGFFSLLVSLVLVVAPLISQMMDIDANQTIKKLRDNLWD